MNHPNFQHSQQWANSITCFRVDVPAEADCCCATGATYASTCYAEVHRRIAGLTTISVYQLLRRTPHIPKHTCPSTKAGVGLGVAAQGGIPGPACAGIVAVLIIVQARFGCAADSRRAQERTRRSERDLEPHQHRPAECWPARWPGKRALSVAVPVIDCAAPQGVQTAALPASVIFTGRLRWSTLTHHVTAEAVLTALTTLSGRSTVVRDPEIGAISVSSYALPIHAARKIARDDLSASQMYSDFN